MASRGQVLLSLASKEVIPNISDPRMYRSTSKESFTPTFIRERGMRKIHWSWCLYRIKRTKMKRRRLGLRIMRLTPRKTKAWEKGSRVIWKTTRGIPIWSGGLWRGPFPKRGDILNRQCSTTTKPKRMRKWTVTASSRSSWGSTKNSRNLNTWASSRGTKRTGSTLIRSYPSSPTPKWCWTWWPIFRCSTRGWATMCSSLRRSWTRTPARRRLRFRRSGDRSS